MLNLRTLAVSVLCAVLFSVSVAAQDLSKYRNFEFGMSTESITKLAGMDLTAIKTVHRRPELIQKLDWVLHGFFDKSAATDSVRNMRFDFYNNELFKIVVSYDTAQTKGLTREDLIEALSALYGSATFPEANIVVSAFQTYDDNQQVLARWESAQYSYSLFRSTYGQSFGLVAFSKRLEIMATAVNREAERLDKLEAPERESARQKKQEEDEQAAQAKARLISKPKFRP